MTGRLCTICSRPSSRRMRQSSAAHETACSFVVIARPGQVEGRQQLGGRRRRFPRRTGGRRRRPILRSKEHHGLCTARVALATSKPRTHMTSNVLSPCSPTRDPRRRGRHAPRPRRDSRLGQRPSNRRQLQNRALFHRGDQTRALPRRRTPHRRLPRRHRRPDLGVHDRRRTHRAAGDRTVITRSRRIAAEASGLALLR